MNAKKILTGCFLLWMGLQSSGHAQTFTLPMAADTFLRQGLPNQNAGSQAILQVSGTQRVLLRADPTAVALAVGSGRLVSASLDLCVRSAGLWGPEGRLVEAYRLAADWTEAGATWNCGVDTQPANVSPNCASQWNGGAFEEEPSDTVVQTNDEDGWIRFDVTADVAAFLAGTAHRGWLVKRADDATAGNADYGSREGTAAERPRLVLLVETAEDDQVPPTLAITSPDRSILLNEPSPAVTIEYADGGSGVDPASFQFLVDGQDATSSCAVGTPSASCHPPALAAGNHTLQARLRDQAGNEAQASFAFQLLLGSGPHLVTLQAVGDTYLRHGAPNQSQGAEPILRLRAAGKNRALMQFDAESLLDSLEGGTLVSAVLELHVEKNGRNWGTQGRTVDAHRVTAAWAEMEATWNCPIDTNTGNLQPNCSPQWNGGSFAPAPTATVLHTNSLAGWVSFDVTADVAAFLSGTPNHGWLLKKTNEGQSGRMDYDSRQGAAGEGPRLVVVFQTEAGTDTEPPAVAITSPAAGSFVATATPTITASYSDAGSGINAASVRLLLDGMDRTAEAQVTASGLAFTPTSPLTEGEHLAVLTVRDSAGNEGSTAVEFTTDTEAPTLLLVTPASSLQYRRSDLQVRFEYTDMTSGILPETFHFLLDDIDQTVACSPAAVSVLCSLASLAPGLHRISGTVQDRAGLQATAGLEFDLQVDETLPVIRLLVPTSPVVNDRTPRIGLELDDSGSGIDESTLQLQLGSSDLAPTCRIDSNLATCELLELPDGDHSFNAVIADRAGNVGSLEFEFRTAADLEAPVLTIVLPETSLVVNDPRPVLQADYSDTGSGIARTGVTVQLDGVELTDSCLIGETSVTCWPPALAPGQHSLEVEVRDEADNSVSASTSFVTLTDTAPPVMTLVSPVPDSAVRATPVLVTGTVTDDDLVVSVRVAGSEVLLVGGAFSAEVDLQEGRNSIEVVARDRSGKEGVTLVAVILDTKPPELVVEKPAGGAQVNTRTVLIEGEVSDGDDPVRLELNGSPVQVSDNRFSVSAALEEGDNLLHLLAIDQAGNTVSRDFSVNSFGLPEVEIAQPADLSYIAATTADIVGTVSGPGITVSVNGMTATVTGTTFRAEGVPLIEGGNIVTATANGSDGHIGTDSINIVRDLTAPRLAVARPLSGSLLFEPTINVSGLVNDIVPGTVNAAQVSVTVNGQAAEVANRSFEAKGVPLALGDNELIVRATDVSGNLGEARVSVRRETPAGPRIATTYGDAQEAVIGTELPVPLTVTLFDAVGLPAAGQTVLFKVRGNNGYLQGGRRWLATTTDVQGRAASLFTLGTRVGVGIPVVEASAVGFRGPAVFSATARPAEPARLFVDSGGQQVGIPGYRLPRPLVAVVTDIGYNRLEGVPIHFAVVQGGGSFSSGGHELTVLSDGDGRAIVPFQLGPEEGIANQVVEAVIEGQGVAVSFTASARAAGEAGLTAVTGVVLDNSNLPIPGVTLRVLGTAISTKTNEQGLFRIESAPVGTITLIVDGSTAEKPGSWPDLEYILTTIPGRENTVEMPIYLLPLQLQAGLPVDENRGGVVELPELPGFSLEIAPGSVTFPGGSRSGVISVTAVHNDKVPMVPNFGQQPRLIVTIQPAGARIDPPARLTLPNLEGLSPGEVTELYSFDHDLGHFVSIGPATVSEDGLLITSNPGVGVVKAGWHCGGNPASSGTPHACKTCWRCTGSACVPVGGPAAAASQGQGVVSPSSAPSVGEVQSLFAAASIFDCPDDGNKCTFDTCFAGKCTHPNVPDGLPCPPDDFDTCTNHVCRSGKCARDPVRCDDCDKCMFGECIADSGKNGKGCEDDFDPCTDDVCKDGNCEHPEKKIESADFELANPYRDGALAHSDEIVFDQQPAQFTADVNSENCDLKHDWEFGDGYSTTVEAPSHTYAETGRYNVKLEVKCGDCERTKKTVTHEIKVGFRATCYFRADEGDYGAPYVTNPNGLTGDFSLRFLQQVRLQGSGRDHLGRFIQIDFGRGDPYASFAQTYFQVVPEIRGASGNVLTLSSIAVDPAIIPLGTAVNVDGLGAKTADDTGGGIHGYHIDVFMGFGRGVCQGWSNPVVPIEGY